MATVTENIMAVGKSVAVPVIIGALLWKYGKGNLMKAMGAGVLGVQAVVVVRSVAGV